MEKPRLAPNNGDAPAIPLQSKSQRNNDGTLPYQRHHQHQHHHKGRQTHHQDNAGSFVARRRPGSIVVDDVNVHERHPRKLVLCFDGTGNKFRGDDSDSNILKIFRMLDRTASDQYHYYQPGIGTYVVGGNLSHTSTKARIRSWYMKAKDSAFGSSFDQHVVGGYRFLMRFYSPGDEIYIFGFSRGAYIARFLAEMLDYVGLLSHGNEEMVHFAWKSFSQWQCRRNVSSKDDSKKKEMYTFMKGFRETFSRPVRRIQFLGLFDTVNSVPRFETAWMERSKFPYTARSSAKVIRHAVSIDERRAKFRQDLIYQSAESANKKHRDARQVLHDVHEKYRARQHSLQVAVASAMLQPGNVRNNHVDDEGKERGRRLAQRPNGNENENKTEKNDADSEDAEDPAPYRPHSRSVSRDSQALRDDISEVSHITPSITRHDDDDVEQDIREVWFSGDHADTGGGWELTPGTKSYSHVPLTWMVREAMRAGLTFDAEKVVAMGCSDVLENQWALNLNDPIAAYDWAAEERGLKVAESGVEEDMDPAQPLSMPPNIRINSQDETITAPSTLETPASSTTNAKAFAANGANGAEAGDVNVRLRTPRSQFHDMMYKAHVAPIHDSLEYDRGLGFMTVTSWKMMEYLPFRRMDLQPDGSWRPIRWPLPCGEVRDVPDNVLVHGSVLRRMLHDPSYRPGNLIVGGGGRGCRIAPSHYGMGEWECVAEEGDPIGEVWRKKKKND
ncbi:hypothetical protein SPI_02173 [Niveomyces insectorum RCEF 264]|uniref:T6SS Phospholipase effector Tle1-like catalytic domain-containing protein n=1 Tax=Niveomyces insectorum RCEF 264 TaxID=1081102 RepID=A0A167XTN2_9HYPO|nr:hypothetical protein SPI_02173 [Niveomyces insectorum RCEF 264]